jgi:hypothetical protein
VNSELGRDVEGNGSDLLSVTVKISLICSMFLALIRCVEFLNEPKCLIYKLNKTVASLAAAPGTKRQYFVSGCLCLRMPSYV